MKLTLLIQIFTIAVSSSAFAAVNTRSPIPISPSIEVDFADPSTPDLSDPRAIRIYTTAGEVLTWAKRDEPIAETLLSKPKYSRLSICHTDGSPLNEEAGEDAWDPTIFEGVLYAGAMTVPRGQSYARWPDDNWSRRTYPFTWNGECWVMRDEPLWGARPSRTTWIGHNYGHEFIRDDDGTLYVFYERVSDDSNGQPWKTEFFARKMTSPYRAAEKEIPIFKIPSKPWPSTRRYSGGALVEGPRPFRAGGKFLISFSAGEYASDNYGIHLLWSDKITGPYRPYMNGNGSDLKNFGKDLEKQIPLTWGAARATFFQSENQWWAVFHGIQRRSTDQDLSEGKRRLYIAPVQIRPQQDAPPRIAF